MTSSIAVSSQPRVFYGWFAVGFVGFVGFVDAGSAYTFSAFAGPMQPEFEVSRGSIGLGCSLASFLNLGLGALSGPPSRTDGARVAWRSPA
jgi:hypothetical protein